MNINCNNDFDSVNLFSDAAGDRERLARITDNADVLDILSYDPDVRTRVEVADNLSTPPEALIRLLSDPYDHVVSCALRNTSTPMSALEDYLMNNDIFYGCAALHNKTLSPELISKYYNRVETVLHSPEFESEWFDGVYDDWYDDFLDDLADNPNTPMSILDEISEIDNEHVWGSIVMRKDTPADLLEYIAGKTEDKGTLWDIAEHPNATEGVFLWLIDNAYSDDDVYQTILDYPNLSPEFLTTMYRECEDIRDEIREHPNYPEDAEDGE